MSTRKINELTGDYQEGDVVRSRRLEYASDADNIEGYSTLYVGRYPFFSRRCEFCNEKVRICMNKMEEVYTGRGGSKYVKTSYKRHGFICPRCGHRFSELI